VCTCALPCVRVFEEKHISLLLLPPSLFFLPADLHSRWVCLLLLPICLSLSLSLSLSLYTSSSLLLGTTRKIQPRTCGALFLFYARIATRNCVARPAARKKRGNGAHLLSTLLLFLLPCLCFPFLSLSTIERRLLLQL